MSRWRQVRSGPSLPRTDFDCWRSAWPSRCARSMRSALKKEPMTSQAMMVTGRAKISVACSMVVTPPAMSMAMVSSAVRMAQKMRSHLAPSWVELVMREEKLAIIIAPELALVR